MSREPATVVPARGPAPESGDGGNGPLSGILWNTDRALGPEGRIDRASWSALGDAPLSPNPFYMPDALEAMLEVQPGLRQRLRILALERSGRLLAIWPVIPRGFWCGWKRTTSCFVSPEITDSLPLVAGDAPDAWAERLLDGMRDCAPGDPLLLPRCDRDSRVGAALLEALERKGWPHHLFPLLPRPVAEAAADYEDFTTRAWSRNRRRSLRRLRNRLEQAGAVLFETGRDPQDCADAAREFLALEARGWKGRAGSALSLAPTTRAMCEALFSPDATPGSRRFDRLKLDGRTIAISLSLVQDGVAFLWKSTYDEAFRHLGPGVLLEDAIIRDLHADSRLRGLNSCAMQETLLDDLFPQTHRIVDIIAFPPGVARPAALLAAERFRRQARSLARRLVHTARRLLRHAPHGARTRRS